MRRIIPILCLMVPMAASADFQRPQPGEVATRSTPGPGDGWQEARTILDAPPTVVERWLNQYEYWPARFRDFKQVRVLSRSGNKARVWVKSDIMRELTLDVTESPGGVDYTAHEGDVHALGKLRIKALGDGRTEVTMSTSANITGFLGAITPKSLIRSRSRDKLVSDLTDLQRLARGRQVAARSAPTQSASDQNTRKF